MDSQPEALLGACMFREKGSNGFGDEREEVHREFKGKVCMDVGWIGWIEWMGEWGEGWTQLIGTKRLCGD